MYHACYVLLVIPCIPVFLNTVGYMEADKPNFSRI